MVLCRVLLVALTAADPQQTQAPVLEADDDDGDGENLVAEQLRVLQEQLNGLQLQHDKADMELQEARLKEEQ